MTDCEKTLEMLSAYYDGELSANDNKLVREHLDTCDSCAALLRLFGDVSETFDDAEPPAELRERVMKQVREAEPVRPAAKRLHILRRAVPVAACLTVALLGITLLKNGGGTKSDSAPPNESVMQDAAMMLAPAAAPPEGEADGHAYDKMTESYNDESALTGDGGASGSEGGAEPKVFGGDAGDMRKNADTEAQASTSPSAPADQPIPLETPPPAVATAPQQMTNGAAPGGGDNTAPVEDLSVYYAVIKLAGDAPQILDGYIRLDTGNGVVRIYVPCEVADVLIREGYDYVLYNEDADEAVILLPPGSR